MNFEIRQRIEGSIEEVKAALLDDRYPAFMLQHHGDLLEVEQLERQEEGSVVTRKVRYRPKPVIERIGTKTVPPEWFSFIQSSRLDRATNEISFTNTPTTARIASMLTNSAIIRLVDQGQHTDRLISGDISLKLPLLLKPFALIGERVIQVEGIKLLEKDVPVMNRFIAEKIRHVS